MEGIDYSPLWLSLKLASITTLLLLIFCVPLAWWLRYQNGLIKAFITTISTLPLVLPPSVLGFYLLLLMGSNGPLGNLAESLQLAPLAFSFNGLVIASVVYSFPFVMQPIANAFSSISERQLETAATLGAAPLDRFVSVVIPQTKPALLTACILGFAHTVGEFGVILMIGGSIPNETRVLSIAIYEHVEALEYAQAHVLAGIMLGFSFCVIFITYWLNHRATSSVLTTYSRTR